MHSCDSCFLSDDYDPVSFTTTAADATGKPPSGRFQLDFTGSQSGGYGGATSFGGMGSGRRQGQEPSPYSSARVKQQYGGNTSSRLGAAAANSFSASGSGYYEGANGASGGRALTFQSPSPSARGGGSGQNSGRMTPSERRAYLERAAEVNAVRDLRQ
jgi:hypothetical protein